MTTREKTKVMVTIIDTTPMNEIAFNEIDKERFPKATKCEAGFSPHGFVETAQGIYALCSEGVGNSKPITADNKYEISFYASYEHGGYMMPAVTAKLTYSDLRKLATNKRENLITFIRTFGARLDSNYYQWRKILEPIIN